MFIIVYEHILFLGTSVFLLAISAIMLRREWKYFAAIVLLILIFVGTTEHFYFQPRLSELKTNLIEMQKFINNIN